METPLKCVPDVKGGAIRPLCRRLVVRSGALAQPGLAEAMYEGRRRLLAKASSSSIRVRPLKGLEKPVRLHEVRWRKER